MALMHVNFFSDCLGMCMNMDVIIPQQTSRQIGMAGKVTGKQYKTIYLLHGMSDDHTIWQRRTSIERYVSELGIAVVMPATHLGFYTDTTYGMRYWTFISKELPHICREFFPQMSDKKEDTLAAGLSMGGYGAWKLALGASDTFGAAASLSGALDIVEEYRLVVDEQAEEHQYHEEEKTSNNHQNKRMLFQGIFGSAERLKGSQDDLFALADKLVNEKKTLPRLYAWCGTEDFLYQDNLKAWEYMRSLGYHLTCNESSGDHQWKYWDEKIQDVLAWWLEK